MLQGKNVDELIVFAPGPGLRQGVKALLNCPARERGPFRPACGARGVQDE